MCDLSLVGVLDGPKAQDWEDALYRELNHSHRELMGDENLHLTLYEFFHWKGRDSLPFQGFADEIVADCGDAGIGALRKSLQSTVVEARPREARWRPRSLQVLADVSMRTDEDEAYPLDVIETACSSAVREWKKSGTKLFCEAFNSLKTPVPLHITLARRENELLPSTQDQLKAWALGNSRRVWPQKLRLKLQVTRAFVTPYNDRKSVEM